MTTRAEELPDDLNALKAMVLSREAENARLRQIIKELQRHRFGRRAETLPEDQLLLGLEEAEQVEANGLEAKEEASAPERQVRVAKRRTNRGSLPAHLPRIEMVVDIVITPVQAAAMICIGLAKTSAKSSTLSPPSSVCWSCAARSMPAGPARMSWFRLRLPPG